MMILSLFLALTSSAFAADTSTTCVIQELNSEASFQLSRAEERLDEVRSSLSLGGQEIQALPAGCVYQNVPGQRGFRCAHKAGDTYYYLYPRFAVVGDPSNSGKVKKLHLIVWQEGGAPVRFETTDCN